MRSDLLMLEFKGSRFDGEHWGVAQPTILLRRRLS